MAVSPLIQGAALKGPADRLMRELGHEATCVGVASFYRGLIGTFVIDVADAEHVDELEKRGLEVRVTTTIMNEPTQSTALARMVLA